MREGPRKPTAQNLKSYISRFGTLPNYISRFGTLPNYISRFGTLPNNTLAIGFEWSDGSRVIPAAPLAASCSPA
eukprot:685751-Amphidinium_carterae.1